MNKKIKLAIAVSLLCIATIVSYSKEGTLIGKISSVDTSDNKIIINYENSKPLKLGEQLYVRIDGKVYIINITFPMMTTAICKLERKNIHQIKKVKNGLNVYLYDAELEKEEIHNNRISSKFTVENAGDLFIKKHKDNNK